MIETDPKVVAEDIKEMKDAGVIDNELSSNLKNLHNVTFKRIENSALPLYGAFEQQDDKVKTTEKKFESQKHCQLVEVVTQDSSKPVYINKTTVVWLFQEGERLSADRMFRVRNKQPYILYLILVTEITDC